MIKPGINGVLRAQNKVVAIPGHGYFQASMPTASRGPPWPLSVSLLGAPAPKRAQTPHGLLSRFDHWLKFCKGRQLVPPRARAGIHARKRKRYALLIFRSPQPPRGLRSQRLLFWRLSRQNDELIVIQIIKDLISP